MLKIMKKVTAGLLALVLLLMLAPAPARADEAEGSRIIVSLGDSYSAGEGIEKFYGQDESLKNKVENDDWLAHRSQNSWPGLLELDGVSGTMADNRDTYWFFAAASGAETKHLKGSFRKDYNKKEGFSLTEGSTYLTGYETLAPQLDVFNRLGGEKAEYVTMTLGGNDAKFADVVTDAVVSSVFMNPSHLSNSLNGIWADFYAEDGIRDDLRKAYRDVAEKAGEQAKIIVAGYPKLLDQGGRGLLFSEEAADMVNDSVSRFNDEIASLINSCKAEGMKICFVSVEEEFDGHEAYAKNDPYLNKVLIGAEDEDLDDKALTSAYSIHPNAQGAKAYARCVQAKIDSIEKDGGKSEWPTMGGSDERDVVLVLDVSGSMDGEPMTETKEAAKKFITTVLQNNTAVGIVTYDTSAMKVADFNMNEAYLHNTVDTINSGGSTNIEGGLALAQEMLRGSGAKKKIIVLMSDGLPNRGLTGDSLVEFADTIKEEGTYIYTLGFFSNVEDKASAQALMERLASEAWHYEVEKAEELVFFFEDIADQIQGTKYTYIRIACPVDVTVSYDGEELCSKADALSQRTSFGTLTFEERQKEESGQDAESDTEEPTDDRIKILRLKEGAAYKVKIEGNGKGQMSYTIGFMDDEGNYSDLRKFYNIKITKKTRIDTVAANVDTTVLRVDIDGDGRYDETYKAGKNEFADLVDYSYLLYIGLGMVAVIAALILTVVLQRRKARKPKAPAEPEEQAQPAVEPAPAPQPPVQQAPAPAAPTAPEPPAREYDFCGKCGRSKKVTALFCPHCGTPCKQKD